MKYKTVCIVGLGYVGLPLAKAFSKHLKTIGFDIDNEKITLLNNNDKGDNLEFTTDPSKIKHTDFVLICVPTPVTKSKEPDLSYVKSAAEIISRNLKKRAIVILESTVYLGLTEEIVKPILMNELILIFHKMGLDTKLVLEAAARKWIFERKRARLLPSLGGCYRINNFTYSGDAI